MHPSQCGYLRAVLLPFAFVGMGHLFACHTVLAQLAPFAQFGGDAGQVRGVYLPSDRPLERAIGRAKERLADGEYTEALPFLQDILRRAEDVFIENGGSGDSLAGLRATALDLLKSLPTEGLNAYELRYGVEAQRLLTTALATRDRAALVAVARQFPYTSAGTEAALVLAQWEADQGNAALAAAMFERLLDNPRVTRAMRPQLAGLAAVAWYTAGETSKARSVLKGLEPQLQRVTIHSLAGDSSLNAEEAIHWLTSAYAPQAMPIASVDAGSYGPWTTHRGDVSRNASRPGGTPHMRARWRMRVANMPKLEDFLARSSEELERREVAVRPAASPIAVGDVVVVKTLRNLVGLDWQTGKRIWETRPELGEEYEQLVGALGSGGERSGSASVHPLEQLAWDDHLAGSISSDGQGVYVVRGLPYFDQRDARAWGMMPVFVGGRDSVEAQTNRLSAYDIPAEGKLIWEIDGDDPNGELAGAFFLGAPLAVEGTLYVLAEIRSAIYLIAIHPDSGQVEWKQHLVSLEIGLQSDPLRRPTAVAPSYHQGVLVCPTAAGAVVAVDLHRRALLWAYRYNREDLLGIQGSTAFVRRAAVNDTRDNDKWLDASAVVVGQHVLLMLDGTDELVCLNLFTGEVRWKQPRDELLYVGGVDDATALLVGKGYVTAGNISDGTKAWPEQQVELPGDSLPSGIGFLSEGIYYVPLTTGDIAAVEVDSGTITTLHGPDSSEGMGNLVCHAGAILSQSALFVHKFAQLSDFQRRSEAALANDPNDPQALRDCGEIQLTGGDLPKAVSLLQESYEIEPNDLLTRQLLAEGLFRLLEQDFAAHHQQAVELLDRLVENPVDQARLMRIVAKGNRAEGDLQGAFEACLRIVALPLPEEIMLSESPDHQVRSDRWVRGLLSALWIDANDAQRSAMRSRIEELAPSSDESIPIAGLQRHVEYFGGLPGSEKVQFQLAERLISAGRFAEAELHLLSLERSSDQAVNAGAVFLMAQLLLDSKNASEAVKYLHRLSSDYTDVTAVNGVSGSEWLGELDTRHEIQAVLAASRWPAGQMQVERNSASDGTPARQRESTDNGNLRPIRIEQALGGSGDAVRPMISLNGALLVGKRNDGSFAFRMNTRTDGPRRGRQSQSAAMFAVRVGHLLFLSLGDEILALDTLHAGESGTADILWRIQDRQSPRNRAQARLVQDLASYHGDSSRRRFVDGADRVGGILGPPSTTGMVLWREEQLVCVDPITGEDLWTRTDIPAGRELLGDEARVLAVSSADNQCYVIDLLDGTLLDTRKTEPVRWLTTAERNLVSLQDSESGPSVTLRDMETGEVLWERKYTSGTKFDTEQPGQMVAVDPAGRIEILDVATARMVIDLEIEPTGQLNDIHWLPQGEYGYLIVNERSPRGASDYRDLGPRFPLINGRIYALDLQEARQLWPRPATVLGAGIALDQPVGLPYLVFASRAVMRRPTGRENHLRLLLIDKRTGASVFDDNVQDTAGSMFLVRAERGTSPSVRVMTNNEEIVFRPTDEPAPPAPPAVAEVEAPTRTGSGGILEILQRAGQALQGASRGRERANGRDGEGRE